MLVGLQHSPEFSVVVDNHLQDFSRDLPSAAVRALTRQNPALDLFHQVLHASGQGDGRVFVDPDRDPGVHHPPEEPPHRKGQPASGRFALPQPVPGAHAVEGERLDGGQHAALGQRPALDELDGALHLEAGALGVHDAEALGLPGDADQSAPQQLGEPPDGLVREGPAAPVPLRLSEDSGDVFIGPRVLLQIRQPRALGKDIRHLGVLRQHRVHRIPAVIPTVHGARVVPPVAPVLRRGEGLGVGLGRGEAEGPAGIPCPITRVQSQILQGLQSRAVYPSHRKDGRAKREAHERWGRSGSLPRSASRSRRPRRQPSSGKAGWSSPGTPAPPRAGYLHAAGRLRSAIFRPGAAVGGGRSGRGPGGSRGSGVGARRAGRAGCARAARRDTCGGSESTSPPRLRRAPRTAACKRAAGRGTNQRRRRGSSPPVKSELGGQYAKQAGGRGSEGTRGQPGARLRECGRCCAPLSAGRCVPIPGPPAQRSPGRAPRKSRLCGDRLPPAPSPLRIGSRCFPAFLSVPERGSRAPGSPPPPRRDQRLNGGLCGLRRSGVPGAERSLCAAVCTAPTLNRAVRVAPGSAPQPLLLGGGSAGRERHLAAARRHVRGSTASRHRAQHGARRCTPTEDREPGGTQSLTACPFLGENHSASALHLCSTGGSKTGFFFSTSF